MHMKIKHIKKWITQENRLRRDRWIAQIAKAVPSGSRVLDIGAGGCPYRSLFSHCIYESQDFVGLNPEQLTQGAYGTINFICDAATIPMPNGSYDIVLCTEVLEHVQRPELVIQEASRLLRLGGSAIFTAPLGSGLHQTPHHYYGGFTPFWYQFVMDDAGFSKICIEPNGGSFLHFSQWCVWFIKSLSPYHANIGVSKRFLYGILWLFTAPCAFALMLISRAIDFLDENNDFTVGYHVHAEKIRDIR